MKKPLFVLLQYCLPHHFFSRMIGCIITCRWRWFKDNLIAWFIKRYHVNMHDAVVEDYRKYSSFNAFFTRQLKPELRPLTACHVASPADGSISQIGSIDDGSILQAKGVSYSLETLVGGDTSVAEPFKKGLFATIYLSPKDYHRVHMPMAGKLLSTHYIPGRLFSVNNLTAQHVSGLFARNERLVCIFETQQGKMAVIFVGAMIVASIFTAFAGMISPSNKNKMTKTDYSHKNISYKLGDELGYFCLGSTVIVLLENAEKPWRADLSADSLVNFGETLA